MLTSHAALVVGALPAAQRVVLRSCGTADAGGVRAVPAAHRPACTQRHSVLRTTFLIAAELSVCRQRTAAWLWKRAGMRQVPLSVVKTVSVASHISFSSNPVTTFPTCAPTLPL